MSGHAGGKAVFSAHSARISYAHGSLVGVEFLGIDETLMQALHRVVDMNLGTPQLLTRDIPALLKSVQSFNRPDQLFAERESGALLLGNTV